ncbi:MAG: PAS domain S-box protein [Methylococcaceae bacterium]|nr:PAS domain S-box protein [Methylococcaceae bacterium]
MSSEIRILMLEDTPEDAELMELELSQAGVSFVALRVQTRDDFLAALDQFQPDIVLSDYRLPSFDGAAALALVKECHPEIPVVMVTGAMGDEMAVDLLKSGARDYVLKDRLARLPAAVLRALAEERESNERKAAEQALKESEEKFRAMAASAQDAIILMNYDGRISFWNAAAEQMFGYSAAEALDQELHGLIAPERFRGDFRAGFVRFRENGTGNVIGRTFETLGRRRDGSELSVEISLSAVKLEERWCAIGIVRDTTERKRAERELYQREEEFRALVENSPDEIIRYDRNCRRLYVNPTLARTYGQDASQLVGKTPRETDPGNPELLAYQERVAGVVASGREDQIELHLGLPGGGPANCLLIRLVPEFDRDGQVASVLGVGRDITTLKETERQLRTLVENLPDLVFRFDSRGCFSYVNPNVITALGQPEAGFIGKTLCEVMPSEECRDLADQVAQVMVSGTPIACEHPLTLRGTERIFDIRHIPERDTSGQIVSVLVIARDITIRKKAEEQLRQAQRVFDHTAEGIIVTDAQVRIVAVNRAFSEITGYSEADVLGRDPKLLASGRQDADFYRTMWASLIQTGCWFGEIWNRRKSGEIYPEWLNISSVEDEQGQVTHYVGVFSDITVAKRSQEALEFLTHHDSLTDLPNRLLCRSRLEHAIQRASREQRKVAVLYVDLDRFKGVNDSLGHPVGDQLLKIVARRMGGRLRQDDTLARMCGDEFVVLLEHSATPHSVVAVAHSLLGLFASAQVVGKHDVYITASIGISLYPDDGEDADGLLRNADLAMRQAKALGRNSYHFFTAALADQASERLQLETALRRAADSGELMVYYQPQIDLLTGTLVGVEALMRWNHPDMGWISPARFVPVAEEMGLIGQLGAWVLQEACRQVIQWRRAGLQVGRVAVNLSVKQLEWETLLPLVSETLVATGLAPGALELEVTESMIMRQTGRAVVALESLRDLGVRLSVDDFGTGYSSLSYLQRLPLHLLKIDQSFVRDLDRDSGDEAIVRAIIGLGRSLGLEVLAEGVETEAQAVWLQREGCQLAQGYLFGRPVSAAELARTWLRRSAASGLLDADGSSILAPSER